MTINDTDNAGSVHDRLMIMGAEMVSQTVDMILDGSVNTIEQESMINNISLKSAPKIFKETCRIDWNNSVKKIEDSRLTHRHGVNLKLLTVHDIQ